VPVGVPAHAAEAVRDTLGGALGVADHVPVGVIDAATGAFAHGLEVVAVTNAVLMLGMAVLAALLLREPRADPHPDPRPELEQDEAVGGRPDVAPALAS
jgi:MFS transporter, DHA2 family, multidrug resistance protein